MKRSPPPFRAPSAQPNLYTSWVLSGNLLHLHYMQTGGKVKCIAHGRRETCSKCRGGLVSRSVCAGMPRSSRGYGDGTSEKTGGSGDMAKVPIKQAQFSKAMFRALKAVRAKRKNYCLM